MVEARRSKRILSASSNQLEAEEPASKRQKLHHEPVAKSVGLINVNIEEQKAAGTQDLKPQGREVIIQFRNNEDKEVGTQISINSGSSKMDLNKILTEFLSEGGSTEFQLYQFFLGDREVKVSL